MITYAYCILLPFQIYTSLGWVTIPATVRLSLAASLRIVPG